ncbi:hypothetical protein SRABI121_01638 [Microbacterium sp. Bi121]|nr:hypothetical protein SRABI121_01638 [Microbacterium sp. Bi121]
MLGGLAVIILGAACAGVQWGANVGYDDALVAFQDTVDGAQADQARLDEAAASLTETMDAATVVAGARTDLLMDAESTAALDAAAESAAVAADEATSLADDSLPVAAAKPVWAWELFGATAQLDEERDDAAQQRDDFDDARDGAEAASEALSDAGMAAVMAAAGAADEFEAAHVSARNLDILDLRRQAEQVSGAVVLDATTAEAYAGLETAAAAMIASEKAELAEKQGPLFQARTEIEAFARGLAPGVLLDFDWSALVNGYGYGDSMGGYATWWYGDPGYSTIELSNSVAEYWPGARSKALVAHEVGHAISVKCEGMYDDSNSGTVEAWATAWAISKGFTDAANGTSAYGAPPQSLIDAAAGCR